MAEEVGNAALDVKKANSDLVRVSELHRLCIHVCVRTLCMRVCMHVRVLTEQLPSCQPNRYIHVLCEDFQEFYLLFAASCTFLCGELRDNDIS